MPELDLTRSLEPATVYLKDYRKPDFLVPTVDLTITLSGELATVVSVISVIRNDIHQRSVVLDGEKMDLLGLKLNGRILADNEFELEAQCLVIFTDLNEFELEITTQLKPSLNTELSGLYKSSGNFCTQCEAEGFRRITYFPDRPDVLSVYTVTLIAEKSECPILLSNGNLISSDDNSDGTHLARWHDPHPKPCYLFALVAGNLKYISDHFVTASGQKVELNIYTQEHNIGKCDHAMKALKDSMVWDEQNYGREYDLSIYNIVAVDDFNMGAMENKGLNVFNSKYVLADQQTATDTDFEGIESVIGHEYFHNWSGNRVTCRDWFQLSLKEGFTVFRDQEFSADMGSRAVKRIRDVQTLRAYQFKEDAGPMSHPIRPESYQEINNFYTVTIYEKGAEVIRMLHSLLGAKGFRNGTDLYFSKFDGQAVTTEDFVGCMEAANNTDLSQFRRWYTQSGTPTVNVEQEYQDGRLIITMIQSCPPTPNQPTKEPFQIPIKMALFSSQGTKIEEETLSLTQARQKFVYDGLSDKPILSLLRDFSAPIKLTVSRTDEELSRLIKIDDNGFSRWEAMQELSLRIIIEALESESISDEAYSVLLVALTSLIESPPEDKAIYSEMLSLPSASYITSLVENVDPIKVVEVREACITRLSRDLESQFHVIYASNNQRAEFSLSADAMAERALKNTALSYLVATDQAAYHALASHQYHMANNMTDRLAAFAALIQSNYPDRNVLVEHFYDQWSDQALVMDKWFALQATSPRVSVLEEVRRLSSHPSFSLNNPNKVRSLVGAFTSNPRGFHRKDGAGYEYLIGKIIELNKINPQVAARLTGTFNNWKSFSEPHRSLMKAQLERLFNQKDLAKDVSEIVSKALQN